MNWSQSEARHAFSPTDLNEKLGVKPNPLVAKGLEAAHQERSLSRGTLLEWDGKRDWSLVVWVEVWIASLHTWERRMKVVRLT